MVLNAQASGTYRGNDPVYVQRLGGGLYSASTNWSAPLAISGWALSFRPRLRRRSLFAGLRFAGRLSRMRGLLGLRIAHRLGQHLDQRWALVFLLSLIDHLRD